MNAAGINNGFPLPITKKATISGFDFPVKRFILDGHNNPGFSGSPFGYHDTTTNQTFIFGVVYGYVNQQNTIHLANGSIAYNENSGIFYAYGFDNVLDIINDLDRKNLLDVM